jgi:sugar phosphate isomerase/epimerase
MSWPHLILPSTTSHKRDPLLPVLEVFSRLGLRDLDLNLWHIVEEGVAVETVKRAVTAGFLRVWMVSGGWCDFFDSEPLIVRTEQSVARQVAVANALGVRTIRLFFGRLAVEDYSGAHLTTIGRNLCRLSDEYPDMTFVFENHGTGASARPEICREILEHVNRANIKCNFDPINFEHIGVSSAGALAVLRPFIGHVHLKGLDGREFCEFGAGTVDIVPVIESLIAGGYHGGFTVEYEGAFDRTVRLYESVRRARSVVQEICHRIGVRPDAI